MSELINNREQRIEVMKNLVRQLHSGAQEEAVRCQLEDLLEEVDYADVFTMERQLIQEGISVESIQELCDMHTRVLARHLDPVETPETTPGHPVHTFLQENRELLIRIKEIRRLYAQIEKMDDEEDALPVMRDIQAQLNDLMDVDKHYRRLENLLFPLFEKKGITGPPAVMWGKHDEARHILKETTRGLQAIDHIPAGEAKAFNSLGVDAAVSAVEDMIYKEEKILFPTALDTLDEAEWHQVYLETPEIGYCLYVPEDEWAPSKAAASNVIQSEKIPTAGGRVQLPTGSFSLQELAAALAVMPFDVTFVDREDVVKYFSPGKDRVFDRTKAILGRKVQYCHPPKSVDVVERILEDFKSGSEDRARFWINMGPRMILISYYAVRGEDGSYLGTMEVTQDVTEIRKLEGEQRLLDYDASPAQ